jgi:DNA replication protein DnaC
MNPNKKSRTSASTYEIAKQSIDAYNAEPGELKYFNCPKCKNKGYVAVMNAAGNDYDMQACDCWKIREALKRITEIGINEDLVLTAYRHDKKWQDDIYQAAVKYTKEDLDKLPWFFIGGQPGAGKTHICTAIVQELISRYPCGYMAWKAEAPKLKAAVLDKKAGWYKSVDVLYIDDFFRGNVTQGDINIAFDILNDRYNKKKPVIISSEKTIKELIDIDEAVASRIFERAKGNCFNISKDVKKNYRIEGWI